MEQDCYPSFSGCIVNDPCLFPRENAYFERKLDSLFVMFLQHFFQYYGRNYLLVYINNNANYLLFLIIICTVHVIYFFLPLS